MLVSMWMTRNPISVPPETPIARAAAEMARRSIRRLLVARGTGDTRRLEGIISARDLARAFPADVNPFSPVAQERGPAGPVSEIMSRQLLTTTPTTPIEDAARALRERKIGAMPVVEGQNLLGIITESDIFRAFIEVLGAREEGIRITFDITKGEDVVTAMAELGKRHHLQVASVISLQHGETRLAVVRLLGREFDRFIDQVWKSGHRVLSLSRSGAPEEVAAGPRR
jgi:acetoin utilization protein AcuB